MKAAKKSVSPYERHYSIFQNIVWYFRFYQKHAPAFLWLALAELLVGAVLPYLRIYLPKLAVDLVSGGAQTRMLLWKLGVLGLLFVLTQALYEAVNRGKYFFYNVRREELLSVLFLKSLRVFYRDTEREEVKELYQKSVDQAAMGDTSSLYKMTYGTLLIIRNVISFALYSTVLGVLSPLMVVLLLTLSLVQYALNYAKIRCLERFRAADADLGRRRRYLSNRVMGDVKAAKEIRIFGMKTWLNGLLDQVFAEMRKLEKTKRRSENLYIQVNGTLTVIRDACAYAYLIWQVSQGRIGAGDFVLYFGAITGFSGFVESIINGVGMLREGNNGVNDYRAYMELPEEVMGNEKECETLESVLLGDKALKYRPLKGKNPEMGSRNTNAKGAEAPEMNLGERKQQEMKASGEEHTGNSEGRRVRHIRELTQPIEITFQDVSFSYSDQNGSGQVFRHFDLTIHGGEKIALVGVNGAGKTTFVKLLCGIYEPQEGRILLNGIDRNEFPRAEVYQLFSAVFQEKFLPPFKVGESVALQKEWSREKVWRALEDAGLKTIFTERGVSPDTFYGKDIDEEGLELSGGQEQRFLLARALYKDAPVLVLDEPTAALDPIAESEVYDSYLKFSENKTAVFISHRLASTRFSDRILLLENGRILEEGTHQELLDRGGQYAEMFQVQSSYYTRTAREKEAFS